MKVVAVGCVDMIALSWYDRVIGCDWLAESVGDDNDLYDDDLLPALRE